jgi:hypothetical protein
MCVWLYQVIGLLKLPLDGSPDKWMGLIAHPGPVTCIDVAKYVSHVTRRHTHVTHMSQHVTPCRMGLIAHPGPVTCIDVAKYGSQHVTPCHKWSQSVTAYHRPLLLRPPLSLTQSPVCTLKFKFKQGRAVPLQRGRAGPLRQHVEGMLDIITYII